MIVDFYAPWCAPCKTLTPVLNELGTKYENLVSIVSINIDNETDAVSKYNIRSVPTLLFFKNGSVVDTTMGAQPIKTIEDKIKEHQ